MSERSKEVADLSVLHIGAGRYKPDDTSHPTFDIWRELARGFRRYTVIGRSTEPVAATLQEGNLTVHLLPSRLVREAEFLFSQFFALKIAKDVGADVVVSQSPVLGGLAGLAICLRLGAKLMVELHTDEFFEPAAIGSSNWVLQKLSAPVLPRAHLVRVLSDGMKKRAVSKYGAEIENHTVALPPRVDLARFLVKSDWGVGSCLKIIIVGSVIKRKRQYELITALLQSDLPVEIWIVGDGPELEACRATAADLGDEDKVRFFGRINHAELSEILPQADVFVMFSTHEGTPRAIMEAMAVGLPVVTTDAGFCADIIEHGVEGLVLGADPKQEIIHVLKHLFDNSELRARMGQAAHQRAVRDYDAGKLYERYRSLIRETAKA